MRRESSRLSGYITAISIITAAVVQPAIKPISR